MEVQRPADARRARATEPIGVILDGLLRGAARQPRALPRSTRAGVHAALARAPTRRRAQSCSGQRIRPSHRYCTDNILTLITYSTMTARVLCCGYAIRDK